MVVAVFPLAKIGLLLLKQLSKPLANTIKNEAKKHPQVRKYVIAPIGKAYNWAETKAIGSLKKKEEVVPITEEEAVELGANALGEMILFSMLCVILVIEISRQGDKKAVQERTKAEEILNLQDMVLDLSNEVTDLKKSLEDVQKYLERPPDIFDLEDQRHSEMTDHDFWDNLGKKKHKKKVDPNSPTD